MTVLLESTKSAFIILLFGLSIILPVSSEATQSNVVLEKEKQFPITTSLPVKDIIVAAKLGLLDRHWDFMNESETAIVASYSKKEYFVKIRLIVSQKLITVQYMDSRNLNYGTDSGEHGDYAKTYPKDTLFIHSSYNRWLDSLFSDIEVEIKRTMVNKGLL